MNPKLRNVLAVIAGWFVGSIVNMGLVSTGHGVYPIPGIDPNDMEALAEIMPTLESEYFLFPFLAHAIGTLVGAFVAALIAQGNKLRLAMIVGALFFIGGILVNFMIMGPMWFTATDLLLAYFPMAWLGGKIGVAISRKKIA